MKYLPLILLIMAALLQFYSQEAIKIQKQETELSEKIKREEKQVPINKNTQRETEQTQNVTIPVNQPIPLSYKTKQEIYEIRKNAIRNSIFQSLNYEPSEEVFGQIEDNKPWVSMKECKYKATGLSDIEGPSEESRFIINPELLVAVGYAFYGYSCEEKETKKLKSSIPSKIKYNKQKNEISVTYEGLPYCNSSNLTWYSFLGLNARDLGYKYAYIDKSKSTLDIQFVEEQNIGNSIIEFQDFIHVGGSCSHKEGCNNASPNQPPLNFYYPCTEGNGEPIHGKRIYIKLWKERPQSPEQEADINEKIIFKTLWLKKQT